MADIDIKVVLASPCLVYDVVVELGADVQTRHGAQLILKLVISFKSRVGLALPVISGVGRITSLLVLSPNDAEPSTS